MFEVESFKVLLKYLERAIDTIKICIFVCCVLCTHFYEG